MPMNNSSDERQEGRKVKIDSKGNKTYEAMSPREEKNKSSKPMEDVRLAYRDYKMLQLSNEKEAKSFEEWKAGKR
jgi:hypothetical protein